MTKKKKIIITILVVILVGVVIWFASAWHDTEEFLSKNYREDVYIDVPDSDLTIVVKYWLWLETGIDFYYVGENKEHVPFNESVIYDQCVAYYPFETGEYEVINNQNGTFTVRWNKHPSNTSPQHWSEITFDFPSQ